MKTTVDRNPMPLVVLPRLVATVEQQVAWVDAWETQLAASRGTAENILSALVAVPIAA
jgi:type I restriction enzyme, S subunit